MADDPKLDRLLRSMPNVFKAGTNPVINALLQGIATSDDNIVEQIQNAKAQLFVRTATGNNLDVIANSLGVSRPSSLGLTDEQFQELIPNLSLKAKQIRKAFYDTAQVFWGPSFIYANVQTSLYGPYDLNNGDTFIVQINQQPEQTVKVLAGDVAILGQATATELAKILSRIKGATASLVTDILTGNEYVNLAVNTPGPRGILDIIGGTMLPKIGITAEVYKLIEQDQRFAVYEINPNELLIEVPAIVPALRRSLLGSHHFHADSTIASPIPPANGIWQGSFLFDPKGVQQEFTVSSQAATLEQTLNKGNVYVSITVNDTSDFIQKSGYLIFGWGTATQEEPVRFRGVPNSNTILIDPSYVFKNNQPSGVTVNVLSSLKPFAPNPDGSDLAIYFTSPSEARDEVESILASLAAAGVIVTFVILAPQYEYLIVNPYLESDLAP